MNESINSNRNTGDGNVILNPWEKMAQDVTGSEKENKDKTRIVELRKGTCKVEGVLTEENTAEINERKNSTVYIVENTVGLTSDTLKKIKTEGVLFSVKGGLDYEKINKYNTEGYKERTMMSPRGLEKAIEYFEHVERGIKPEWSDLQKAMYCYGCLADDFSYGEKTDKILSPGCAARGLNGIMYGELVCAGFAFVYQEMMNRQGIECHYSNQKDTHAYNVLKIDDKYYGVDVTWDNTHKGLDGKCGFREFGHDSQFYERNGHLNYREEDDLDGDFENSETIKIYDEDEQRFSLSTFSLEELRANYRVISERLERRQVGTYTGFKEQPVEVREKYLPVDLIDRKLVREANQEYNQYAAVLRLLKNDGNLTIDQKLVDATSQRISYVVDMIDDRYASGAKEYYGKELDRYDVLQSMLNRNGEMGEEQTMELSNCIDDLNQELSTSITQHIIDTYNGIGVIIEDYEYDPVDSDADRLNVECDLRTKMEMILRAKDLLVENGISESEVEATCIAISAKLEDSRARLKIPEKTKRENGIDFIGGVFADKDRIRKDIEYIEGHALSDEEFQQRSVDANYLLKSVYTNLDLDEYGLTVDDFQKILNGEI